jgi:predicted glycosyltransferase involved in capsule biosynthesis
MVRSEFFMVSDADLVYKPEALGSLIGPADPKKCVVIPRKKQVVALWSSDWGKADSVDGKLTSTNGSFFMARDTFAKVRGFDEAFVGCGSEDDDFYSRIGFAGVGVVRPGFASDALAIHLYHKEHHTINVQQRALNRQRRDSQMRLVADKKMSPWDVNVDGWGE